VTDPQLLSRFGATLLLSCGEIVIERNDDAIRPFIYQTRSESDPDGKRLALLNQQRF
jgi:hypothetical protein